MPRVAPLATALMCAGVTLRATVGFAQDDFMLGDIALPKPAPVLFTSLVELGVGHQSDDSFHFARYGGIADRGTYVFGQGALQGRAQWESGQTNFWSVDFNIAGPDFRSGRVTFGEQGRWKIAGFYNAFTRAYTESAKTPLNGAGTSRLTLPANWISGNTSLRFTTLDQNLKALELKTDWQTVGGDYVLTPKPGYELRFHFENRKREGLMANSLTFGHEANFPVGVFFPQPIDYDSSRAKFSIGYADQTWQWDASYTFSTFSNAIKSVTVANPYSRSLGLPWPGGAFAGFPFSAGQYSLPPDNTAHQLGFTGGVAISPKTRLTARLSYASQKQNNPFLPYTTVAGLEIHTPMPRTSLHGDVRKTFANIALVSREFEKTDFSASYTFDDRDNNSPRDLYNYIPNDAQDQVRTAIPGNSRFIRFNLPHSFTFHQVKAEAGYRIAPRTRLSVSYGGDFKSRTYQQVAESDEHTFKAKILSSFDAGSAWVSVSHADRSGSAYIDDASWNASHTLNYLNASPLNQSIEHPLLRKYHLADRKRTEAKGGAAYDITEAIAFDAAAGYARDNYHHTEIGLRESESLLLDASVAYTFAKRFTASAFYSFEDMRFGQKGYFNFTASLTNPAQEWAATSKDKIHTAGVKADWQAIPDTLKLEVSYSLSDGTPTTEVRATAFTPLAAVSALPDAREITHNASVRADFNIRPETTLRAGYLFERHRAQDWQYDNIGLTPVAQILGSGILPPRYTVHVVTVSALYRF